MTPEEILAECPEYFVLDWVRKSPTIYKERGTGRDVNPKEVEKIATSRKEARELREQNAKLVETLEKYSNENNFSITVWQDGDKSKSCWLEPASEYGLTEIIGPHAHQDFGIWAEDILEEYRSTQNV